MKKDKGHRNPCIMASLHAGLDDKEKPAPGTSDGGTEKLQEDAKATKPGVEGPEEKVRPGMLEGLPEKQLDKDLAGDERGKMQLQLESSGTQ